MREFNKLFESMLKAEKRYSVQVEGDLYAGTGFYLYDVSPAFIEGEYPFSSEFVKDMKVESVLKDLTSPRLEKLQDMGSVKDGKLTLRKFAYDETFIYVNEKFLELNPYKKLKLGYYVNTDKIVSKNSPVYVSDGVRVFGYIMPKLYVETVA